MRRPASCSLSELLIVVAIILIIVATAIPNLLLARIADRESEVPKSPAWARFLK